MQVSTTQPPAPPVAASSAAPTVPAPLDAPVLIAGGGIAGITTALELAHQGVRSVVLEKRGPVATRQNLFNLVPPVLDNLQRLDPGGELMSKVAAVQSITIGAPGAPETKTRDFSTPKMAPDPTRSRGDVKALLSSMQPPSVAGADNRRWGRIGIAELENALRGFATSRFGDLIELRTDTAVTGARTVGDHVEATVQAGGDAAAQDTLRGAFLVDATAGRLDGGRWKRTGQDATWVGTRFEGVDSTGTVMRTQRDPDGVHARTNVVLEHPARSIAWSQLPAGVDPATTDQAGRDAIAVADARSVGVTGEQLPLPTGDRLQARVRPGYNSSAVRGRIVTVGDGSREPFFPTSSGAAMAIVHDAPIAADAIVASLRDPGSKDHEMRSYAMRMSHANRALTTASSARFEQLSGRLPAADE